MVSIGITKGNYYPDSSEYEYTNMYVIQTTESIESTQPIVIYSCHEFENKYTLKYIDDNV